MSPRRSEGRDTASADGESDDAQPQPASPSAWSAVRRALEELGFRPSKRLGQNLLVDTNMARAIAREAGIARGDFVLEIGPGTGALTVQLLELGARVTAVEIDARLLSVAQRTLAGRGEIVWLHGDALDGKHALSAELVALLPAQGDWHVVSNLPYSAGTPILALLARLAHAPRTMTVLLQRELAERIAAQPGGKEWGPISVRLQLAYDIAVVRTVPPQLFWPRPTIESSLLRLVRRGDAPQGDDWPALDALLDALFQHRRQAIGGLLAKGLGGRPQATLLLGRHGLDPSQRPEKLTAAELLGLSRDPLWRAICAS